MDVESGMMQWFLVQYKENETASLKRFWQWIVVSASCCLSVSFSYPFISTLRPKTETMGSWINFGHCRYKYCISDAGFVDTVFIDAEALLRPVAVVVDGYWLRQSYGPFKLFHELDDTSEIHRAIGFFSVIWVSHYKDEHCLSREADDLNNEDVTRKWLIFS